MGNKASVQAADPLADEVLQLRRCVRDLVALSALPAVWSAGDARGIAENLADILLRTLHLDLIYIRLTGSLDGAALEVVQVDSRRDSAEWAREIGGRLEPWLRSESSDRSLSIPDPAGDGTLRAIVVPIGIAGDCGFVAAGSRRAEFPVQTDRLLLGVAANQAAILVQRKGLEDELQKRVEQLAEADRRKDEFLATLAHELRNPLAPLRNALQIIRKGGMNERVQGMMERQVHHMVHLVDDLLEVSRITRGKIELRRERVELSTIVQNAIETSHPLIEASRHELSVTLPPEPLMLDADPVRLAQVVANLLNNAAKYTDPGGRIWLTAGREGGEAVIRVLDSGIGIPPEMMPRIFEMFAQADRSLGRSQGGLGIGLTLVRNLVQMHGGSLQAASAGPGQGSEFTVRLPLASEDRLLREGGLEADSKASGPAARRILVVDDNEDAADSLGMLLEMLGNDVQVAHDGPSALAAMGARPPEIVLLDIGMPGMDGYEVAHWIRAQPELRGAVLIALTGWGQEEDRRRSREAGFDHHLTKPVDLKVLQTLLSTL
ncbi:MAG TPA: ATP-binding protein [Thermoanaerobaculia bacterium]